ncbi:hypothetical protein ABWL39_04225 [Chitinivorax sp. PXF-14]|uniref:hypothetical protein n=1 Tax=Chitinivorax sp. PXF-14 TaxID=3230488 RepID=UPI003467D7DF
MYLPDPRLFARVAPNNVFIRQVMRVLTAGESAERASANAELQRLLRDALEMGDDAGLQGALALAPSQEAYKYLWTELREVLEAAPEAGQRAVVFAIPVLMVAAANKGQVPVSGKLTDVDALVATLKQHGVFADTPEISLSSRLVTLQTLQSWAPSQLWRWAEHLQDAARGVPVDLPEGGFVASSEAVHLRFLVGVALQHAGQPLPVKMGADAAKWGMVLSQQINEQLKQDGLSLLAIPRGPQPLLQAMQSGRFARLEAGLQLLASATIRKIRQAGEDPVAVMSAHDNHELRFTLSARQNSERWEGYVWPLHPLDSVELIRDNAEALLRECRVDDIRVVEEVQPDMQDGLPLFLKAHNTPPNA